MELRAMCTLVPDASVPTRLSGPSDFPAINCGAADAAPFFYAITSLRGLRIGICATHGEVALLHKPVKLAAPVKYFQCV